jgi:CubicO group peptidase (beta-lactamase class C family)
MTIPFSAGGLYSTIEDLLRWERGLFGGKLLSPVSFKEMLTPFKNEYAFGLFVAIMNGHQVIDHGGRIPGFDTALIYYPEDKLTVIVLGNTDVDAAPKIALDLGTLALGGKVVSLSQH